MMKKFVIAALLLAGSMSAFVKVKNDALSVDNTKSETIVPASKTEVYLEDNKAWSGMFFTSESVVEEYEYDDVYCLLYDDADANMYNVEICVDLETYQLVMDAIKNDHELVGKLVLNEDYTTEELQVFTYMTDSEFEMFEADININ